MLTKTTGILLILTVFAFACDKGQQAAPESESSDETTRSVTTKTDTATVTTAPKVAKNLVVMQYYALPG